MEWWKVDFESILNMEQIRFFNWLDVGCEQRKVDKEDSQIFGLSNWENGIAIN